MKPKDEEGPGLFRAGTLYREWGCRFTTLKQIMKAIEYFTKSIELSDGNDLRTLLGLTSAFTSFMRHKAAAEIANMCMKIDPNNYQVIWARVKTLYKITEFEQSLIYAYQGQRLRPFPFKWGIYQSNETIEDCVGNNTSPIALMELYPWIKEMEDFLQELKAKTNQIKDEFEGIDEDKSKFKVDDEAAKNEAYLKKHQSYMAKIYLGPLADDKNFAEEMLQRPEIWSANIKSSRELENLAKSCFIRLNGRQDMLRVRRPLYLFRFVQKARPAGHKRSIQREKEIQKNNLLKYANFLLNTLNNLRIQKDYVQFFRLTERIKTIFDDLTEKMFPIKQECLERLYNMIALTYLESRDLSLIKDEEKRKTYLKHHVGIQVTKLPRDVDIGWVPFSKRKTTLQKIKKRLALTNDPLELAWIFHDFSKLFMEMGRYDWARYYAKRAQDKSTSISSQAWFINATHLLLRIEIHQHNRNEAKDAALLALSSARQQEIAYLEDFYEGIIQILTETDVEKMAFIDSIAIREQLVVDLMPNELKPKMDYIFRSMAAIPSNRRLSVMPGCKPIDKKFNLPRKRNTILEKPPRDLEKEMRKAFLKKYSLTNKIPGFVDFGDYD